MFAKIIYTYFGLMGFIALAVLLYVIGYSFYHLLKKKKVTGLILLIGIIGLFFISMSYKIIVLCAAIVLLVNIAFYVVFTARTLFKRKRSEISENYPSVSILIPAKNEAKVLEDTLVSLSEQDYPISKFEIIVIDDNSTDQTYELCKSLRSISNLKVIKNKQSLGKARALNEVLKTLNSEYTVILDADHLTDKSFIKKALCNFKNPKVACMQGKNLIRNGKTNLLCRLIQIEYYSRYEIIYPGKKMALFMGSGAMFRTICLKEVNGFSEEMLTEDLEVSYKLYENGNIIAFDNTIATYELATEDLKNFYKQRHRWFRGIWQSFQAHFSRMALSKSIPIPARIYFLHIIIENITLSSVLLFSALFALDYTGVSAFAYKNVLFG